VGRLRVRGLRLWFRLRWVGLWRTRSSRRNRFRLDGFGMYRRLWVWLRVWGLWGHGWLDGNRLGLYGLRPYRRLGEIAVDDRREWSGRRRVG